MVERKRSWAKGGYKAVERGNGFLNLVSLANGPEFRSRARRLFALSVPIQYAQPDSNNTQHSFLAVDMSACRVAYRYWHGRCAADCTHLRSILPYLHITGHCRNGVVVKVVQSPIHCSFDWCYAYSSESTYPYMWITARTVPVP